MRVEAISHSLHRFQKTTRYSGGIISKYDLLTLHILVFSHLVSDAWSDEPLHHVRGSKSVKKSILIFSPKNPLGGTVLREDTPYERYTVSISKRAKWAMHRTSDARRVLTSKHQRAPLTCIWALDQALTKASMTLSYVPSHIITFLFFLQDPLLQ